MKPIAWNDSLDTGVRQIDDQHRHLVSIVNLYVMAVNGGRDVSVMKKILKDLREYTILHFRDEEGIMAQAGYPGLPEHRRKHEELVGQVKDYQRNAFLGRVAAPSGFADFLKEWLIDHILQTDMELGKFLKSRGLDA